MYMARQDSASEGYPPRLSVTRVEPWRIFELKAALRFSVVGLPRLHTTPVLFPSRFTAVGTQTFSLDRPLFAERIPLFLVLCRRAEPETF